MTNEILIFCDGGLGNRLNALFSGVALAQTLGTDFRVGWPVNSWCGARFEDIFSAPCKVDDRLLSTYRVEVDRYRCYTHDAVSAGVLGTEFCSAYGFDSVTDFAQKSAPNHKSILFYPALIPKWIPPERIISAVKSLPIRETLRSQARAFVFNDLAMSPFYGVHLRRTDLKTGYLDEEVDNLTQRYPHEKFFVCSDDPRAERRAACNPNVRVRRKSSYAEKQNSALDWQTATPDDDGRVYHSNITRGNESIREAMVDMLVLGHGRVMEVGGSTFRSMAQILGAAVPLFELPKPQPIKYASFADYSRQVSTNATPLDIARLLAKSLESEGRSNEAIKILKQVVYTADSSATLGTMAEIGRLYFGLNDVVEAKVWYQAALHHDPGNPTLQLNLQVVERSLERRGVL